MFGEVRADQLLAGRGAEQIGPAVPLAHERLDDVFRRRDAESARRSRGAIVWSRRRGSCRAESSSRSQRPRWSTSPSRAARRAARGTRRRATSSGTRARARRAAHACRRAPKSAHAPSRLQRARLEGRRRPHADSDGRREEGGRRRVQLQSVQRVEASHREVGELQLGCRRPCRLGGRRRGRGAASPSAHVTLVPASLAYRRRPRTADARARAAARRSCRSPRRASERGRGREVVERSGRACEPAREARWELAEEGADGGEDRWRGLGGRRDAEARDTWRRQRDCLPPWRDARAPVVAPTRRDRERRPTS